MRIGLGYDIHRFASGRRLFLGGVEIPHPRGLIGHSDADIILHALCDALLGAMGEADIGVHFPSSDPAFKDAPGLKLLEQVKGLLQGAGFRVVNADVMVILEEPKIAPYIPEMKKRISACLGIPVSDIAIKATTQEGLGSIGAKEGAAAHAVALIEKKD
ncbi:MAG: 2-C-methyl-D-erythritol 2,4-cyclodiphosphate synthase [Candidatus Omnitrophota bacterium]